MITELKVGDYIEKSELDTKQKYNDVVEVFGQWGFLFHGLAECRYEALGGGLNINNGWLCMYHLFTESSRLLKRKLTYNQVMSLKKVDVDNCNIDKVAGSCVTKWEDGQKVYECRGAMDVDEVFREDADCKEMVKAAKASLAMESLGYEYDKDKQQWFRREYL